ncbi:hypothetical protein LTR10_021558 [Elasticomyces elasticus]|nr:hypothetical protein LTR10_021558 [Elasticomyces elasticus]KAK5039493.1 hypothetical protein LTR13_003750 [Exophiala sideris]
MTSQTVVHTVLVTGANSFYAAAIMNELVKRGVFIHGAVRNESARGPLEARYGPNIKVFIVPDITTPSAFNEAVRGCDAVFHVASPLKYHFSDARTEVLDPSIQGALSALQAATTEPKVKRVIYTSSVASMLHPLHESGFLRPGYTYTEADWNPLTYEQASPLKAFGPVYTASKALAERAAWDFMNSETRTFDLVCINPTHTLGSYHQYLPSRSAMNFTNSDLAKLMDGEESDVPPTPMPWVVNIKEVVQAHINSFYKPEANGRYIVANHAFDFQMVIDVMYDQFGDSEWIKNVPRGTPGKKMVGDHFVLDNTRSREELGVVFASPLLVGLCIYMATLYHYFSEKGRVGGPWTHSTRDSVRVSEVWEHRDGRAQRYSSQSMVLSESNVKKWLETPDGHDTSSCTGDGSSVRRLRIVWIPRLVQNRMFDVSEAIFKVVHDITELALAQKYCETTSAGIGTVPNLSKTRILQHFSYQPKISLVWTADVKCQLTTMICSADEPKLSILEGLINQEFAQRVAGHPLAGALFSMVLFTQEIQDTQEAIKQQVRHVEVRTGHHDWKSRVEKPALGDLVALAAKMSGCETRIGSCLRKQSVLNEMIAFFEKDSGDIGISEKDDEIPHELLALVLESVAILKRRAAAQEIDTTFIQRRVRTQIDAIYHLVQENDAWSANEMARDCKLLAMASQHDSASMKCIAVVTMFFLPGRVDQSHASYLVLAPKDHYFPGSNTAHHVGDFWNLGILDSDASRQGKEKDHFGTDTAASGSFGG